MTTDSGAGGAGATGSVSGASGGGATGSSDVVGVGALLVDGESEVEATAARAGAVVVTVLVAGTGVAAGAGEASAAGISAMAPTISANAAEPTTGHRLETGSSGVCQVNGASASAATYPAIDCWASAAYESNR
ncbi:hypothetical protein [Dietzia psychralcaliphila]|uniref:hypothetical protein n=1 Tax=Dietzia psychralcaliphila TaxID=139021 RepID=UPI001C1E0D2D|nr:hypothetical protein [Dietzia psychralcaliphila]